MKGFRDKYMPMDPLYPGADPEGVVWGGGHSREVGLWYQVPKLPFLYETPDHDSKPKSFSGARGSSFQG